MNVLAIEPYYGGSHRAFLDALVTDSRHRWVTATLPARHWKWRMRSAPVSILEPVLDAVNRCERPSVIFATDMLDLPTLLGFASRDERLREPFSGVPIVTYFHENQWEYPTAPGAQVDHHFGYTNLLSASLSSECWFNSEFNRTSFLEQSSAFLGRMPDSRKSIDLSRIAELSRIVPPGFTPPMQRSDYRSGRHPVRIGWVGRFEHDKRPDRFLDLLKRLSARELAFELILLGQRGRNCETLDVIGHSFGSSIRFDGYAESREEYERCLAEMDFVVSTADHEFFGVAICEAIWAGAIPITPNGLSYVEYVPDALRYDSLEQAVSIILRSIEDGDPQSLSENCRNRIADCRIDQVVTLIDSELDRVQSD